MLFLAFTLIPAIEIYLLIQIGQAVGGFETFLLIILTGIVGARLARSQGFALLRKIQEEAASGIPSSQTVAEGLLILIGGILLITPGVITDGIGLLFIFPLSRKFMAPQVLRRMERRGSFGGGGVYFGGMGPGMGPGMGQPPGFPPEATVVDEADASPKDRFKHPVQ